ncbi:MAG TPA: peroxiredoxin [Gemmataceae bacterium]|jgi:peroxiredoxin Q/BCP|nr:peroxiredoxin [Gemmataceae bacterium]
MVPSVLRISALGCALGLLAPAAPAQDKPAEKVIDLKVGDPAPTFATPDAQGESWDAAEHYGRKWVVIYFYPGDFTPGCIAQANAFRDAMNKLTEQGVEVVGVSGDSVQTHALFRKAQKLNFNLLSDEDGTVARLFGVPVGKGATVKARDAAGNAIEFTRAATLSRWTFVVGKDGKVVYKNTKVTPAADARAIQEFMAKEQEKKQ